MTCPNCGLANASDAKFCANCGTSFGAAPPQQPYRPEQAPPPSPSQNLFTGRNLGLGCLIVVLLFLLVGMSCMRACVFGGRRGYIQQRYRRVDFRPHYGRSIVISKAPMYLSAAP